MFRIELPDYRGPLDLLLYLVRKREVELVEIALAEVVDQYLAYVAVLEQLELNDVGDFLEVAGTLIEIKSRMVLPHGEEEEEPLDEVRHELVERLLEYKKYKDAASVLDERSRVWQQRYPRQAIDTVSREEELAGQLPREVELWDLVSALGRVMRENEIVRPANIVYDDTPITTYMDRIHHELTHSQRVAFSDLFQPGMHKSAVIGVFLAILELVRHHAVNAEQAEPHGDIWVLPGQNFSEKVDLSRVSTYAHEYESDA